jgi:hypothetical protein
MLARKILVLLLPAIALFAVHSRGLGQAESSAPGSTKGPGGIVSTVGDDVITQAELDKRVERRRAQLLASMPASAIDREYLRLQKMELERMIEDKLILQLIKLEEKKAEHSFITEAHIDAEIDRQVETLKKSGVGVKTPEDLYRLSREREGLTREEYRKNVKEKLLINSYLWQKRIFHGEEEFVPPQAMKAYYLSHRDEFTTPVELSFYQLIIKPTRDTRTEYLLGKTKSGLLEGQDFVELSRTVAEAQGDDPDAAARLQTRTFAELKNWLKPIAEVLRTMKKGEVSELVRTTQDIRVFKVVSVTEGTPRPFEEVQEEISLRIRQENNQSSLDSFLERQKQKTRIVRYLPELAPEK